MLRCVDTVPSRDFTSLQKEINAGGKASPFGASRIAKRLDIMAALWVRLHLEERNDFRRG
jgi:hypothetical protein